MILSNLTSLLDKYSELIAFSLKSQVPVKTGNLRESITISINSEFISEVSKLVDPSIKVSAYNHGNKFSRTSVRDIFNLFPAFLHIDLAHYWRFIRRKVGSSVLPEPVPLSALERINPSKKSAIEPDVDLPQLSRQRYSVINSLGGFRAALISALAKDIALSIKNG